MIIGRPIVPIGGKAAKGSQLFLAVTLPPSIYYAQASEWLKIKENPKAAVAEANWDGQVVCGGHLWELYGNNAYCYSLEDGELLETVALTGISGYSSLAIATDGVSRIWIVREEFSGRTSKYGSAVNSYIGYLYSTIVLYEFDIDSKSVKLLHSISVGSYAATISMHKVSYSAVSPGVHRAGILGYSEKSNKIYFGKQYVTGTISFYGASTSSGDLNLRSVSASGSSNRMFAYDLMENTCTEIAAHPYNDSYMGQYFYDTDDFFYVGNGYIGADKDKRICRYNKQSNLWETVSTAFEGYTVGPFAYVDLGDKMLQISQTATGVFDPITGELDPSPVPVVPPDSTVIYPCFKAYANNILYLITQQGVYKCPFYTEVPEDAPIVCKIYKGQKYHTLEPFEIPGKISLLRTQQVADRDIEIKMYEYSSEGGQTIYIEDTGEELS